MYQTLLTPMGDLTYSEEWKGWSGEKVGVAGEGGEERRDTGIDLYN